MKLKEAIKEYEDKSCIACGLEVKDESKYCELCYCKGNSAYVEWNAIVHEYRTWNIRI